MDVRPGDGAPNRGSTGIAAASDAAIGEHHRSPD
jgi:hypothetical protein